MQAPPKPTEKASLVPESLTTLNPPADEYYVDQFKNGSFLDKRPLIKNRIIFGRAPDCDIVLEHPSISRYHAALLWSPKDDKQYQDGTNTESFWYLIDCGSTHGTVCNKVNMDAGKMIKLRPNNNVFKFGASTRFFTLGCDSLIESEESDSTVDIVPNKKAASKESENTDDGCIWGIQMTDCNDDEEETGDSLALKSIISAMKGGGDMPETSNKSTYSDNPYKCIVQWFEREGYDFDFKVDAINDKFKCCFELPVDGQWISIEGSLTNRKKEAIADACLKCCNILDQAQLLFPWQKQNALKKSRTDSSDEDEILDETATSCNKKLKKDPEDATVDNYETLNAKWKAINEELCQLKVKLATIGLEAGATPEVPPDLTDSLDIYLATMNKKKFGLSLNDKIVKSNMRIKIKQLEQEQKKLEKLIQISKPSEIKIFSTANNAKHKSKVDTNDVSQVSDTIPNLAASNDDSNKTLEPTSNGISPAESFVAPALPVSSYTEHLRKPPETKSKASVKEIRKLKQNSIIEAIEKEKKLEKQKMHAPFAPESESDYIGWVPPTSQSGDGKTHLNEKFGY